MDMFVLQDAKPPCLYTFGCCVIDMTSVIGEMSVLGWAVTFEKTDVGLWLSEKQRWNVGCGF